MTTLWRRRIREPGWLAVCLRPDALSFAHGTYGQQGLPAITRCGTRALEGSVKDIDRVAREIGFERYQCTTVLSQGEYQLMVMDAPNVPSAELKAAVRWRMKDMLDYPLDDATIDVLDIPPDPSGGARGHSLYAVAAKNQTVQACIERFDAAGIGLSVIDIAETAQRNIAALFEPAGRGVGFLYLDAAHALLTVNFRGELYLACRIDVGIDLLTKGADEAKAEALSRITLELQRSFDHFDRQFPFVGLAKLLLGPEPEDTGLKRHLSQNMDLPVEEAPLAEALRFGTGAELHGDSAWRLFHLVGAALRNEAKTL